MTETHEKRLVEIVREISSLRQDAVTLYCMSIGETLDKKINAVSCFLAASKKLYDIDSRITALIDEHYLLRHEKGENLE